MQVGRLADLDRLAFRQNGFKVIASGLQAADRLLVDRDAGFAAGCRGPASRLCFDQIADAGPAVSEDFGGPANGRRHHLVIDHHQAQVVAGHAFLDQDVIGECLCGVHRCQHLIEFCQADRYSFSLLASRRFDDHRTVRLEKRFGFRSVSGKHLFRNGQTRFGNNSLGHRFVIADRHGDAACEVGQGFPTTNGAATIGQAEESAFSVENFRTNAPPPGLVEDDGRIWVELFLNRGTCIKRFVDRVLHLHGEEGDALEPELFVERNGLGVVVHHRQVHVGDAPAFELLCKPAYKCFADAWEPGLGRDGQTPERGPLVRAVGRHVVVDAHGGADDLARFVFFRHEHGHFPLVHLVPEEIQRYRNHVPAAVKHVDSLGIPA